MTQRYLPLEPAEAVVCRHSPTTSGKPTNRTAKVITSTRRSPLYSLIRTAPGIREAKGTAIKVVVPLLTGLPRKLRKPDSEPEPLHYRLLFMERDMGETLQSQHTMLRGIGKSPAAGEKTADISKAYRQQERHAKSRCANLGIHAMSVSFEALVHHPDQILPQLAGFLGTTGKLPAMRACVDPALHRTRKTGPPLKADF